MVHFFDVEVAQKYGMECAVVFQNIAFWVDHNKQNGVHYHDDAYWTYNSSKAFEALFPYMSYQKIGRALLKLEESGLIKSGNYNTSHFDKTKWYTLTEVGYSIYQNRNIDLSNLINREIKNDQPIPYINTDIKTNINNISVSKDTECQTDVRRDIERVVNEWNSLSALGIPAVSKMSSSSKRYKMLKARIAEYGIEDVLNAIGNVKQSDFLLGKHGGKPWSITFDWFVCPNNFPKVLEGNYSNRECNSSESTYVPPVFGDFSRRQ